MKIYLETITVPFDPPFQRWGWTKSTCEEKQGAGLKNHSACEKRWIFGGSLRLERRCLDQPPAVPAATEKHRDVTNHELPQVDFNSLDVFCGFRISVMFFHDVSLWRSCRFQCILEKRCWKKCWPTSFVSLIVLLESELVCEVWEDYLNKLLFDVVSESNWELFRTASWNQDVDSLWKWPCLLGANRPMGFLSSRTCWKTIHGVDRVWFCWKNQQPADEDWSFLFWRWGVDFFASVQGKVAGAALVCFLHLPGILSSRNSCECWSVLDTSVCKAMDDCNTSVSHSFSSQYTKLSKIYIHGMIFLQKQFWKQPIFMFPSHIHLSAIQHHRGHQDVPTRSLEGPGRVASRCIRGCISRYLHSRNPVSDISSLWFQKFRVWKL